MIFGRLAPGPTFYGSHGYAMTDRTSRLRVTVTVAERLSWQNHASTDTVSHRRQWSKFSDRRESPGLVKHPGVLGTKVLHNSG